LSEIATVEAGYTGASLNSVRQNIEGFVGNVQTAV
jgi:hypothetical protein